MLVADHCVREIRGSVQRLMIHERVVISVVLEINLQAMLRIQLS